MFGSSENSLSSKIERRKVFESDSRVQARLSAMFGVVLHLPRESWGSSTTFGLPQITQLPRASSGNFGLFRKLLLRLKISLPSDIIAGNLKPFLDTCFCFKLVLLELHRWEPSAIFGVLLHLPRWNSQFREPRLENIRTKIQIESIYEP